MPFCDQCGSALEPGDRFCAKCGRPAQSAPAGPATLPGASAAGLPENVAAALCYLLGLITGVLFLLVEPYSRNRLIRFHAFQSIFVSAAWFVLWTVIMFMFRGAGFLLAPLLSLGFFVLWLYLIVMTYQGRKVVLPVIGPWAEQQAAG